MVQLACVEVPAFPLQIVLQRYPDWRSQPVAVITEERPQGKILWTNALARQQGIQPGMRFSTAITYAATLRTSVVTEEDLRHSSEAIAGLLQQFSPLVERARATPHTFWLDASGLLGLYASLSAWSHAVAEKLQHQGWKVRVVVGFSRLATAALAQMASQTVSVLASREDEAAAVQPVLLTSLSFPPQAMHTLGLLGLRTVGDLQRLPPGSLRERFGAELARFVHELTTTDWPPLQGWQPQLPLSTSLDLEFPEHDQIRLLFLFRRLLSPLLQTLYTQHQALTELVWYLLLDDHTQRSDHVKLATPTLNIVQLIDLARIRIATYTLSAGVRHLTLTVHSCQASDEQLRLFPLASGRDLAAANRALARVRAAFGDQAVVRARLRDGHLPEAQSVWETLHDISVPRPCFHATPTLVRRTLTQPVVLRAPQPRSRNEGWLLAGEALGAATQLSKPFRITGGWWHCLVEREYAYIETQRGDLLWVFYDRRRRRWMLQGRVE